VNFECKNLIKCFWLNKDEMGLRRKFFRKFCLGFTLSKSISSLSNVEQRFDGARIIEVHRRQLLGGNGAIAMASSALNVHEMRQKCVVLKFFLRLMLRPRPSWGSLRRCHTNSRMAGSWNPSLYPTPTLGASTVAHLALHSVLAAPIIYKTGRRCRSQSFDQSCG